MDQGSNLRGPRRDFNGNRGQGNYRRMVMGPPRERVQDEILGERVITTDRKTIKLTHRKNRGGQFLRIDETRVGQDRGVPVMIPAEAIEDFFAALEELFPENPAE